MSLTTTILRSASILGVAGAAFLGAAVLPGASAQASAPVELIGLGSHKCVDIRAEDGPSHARAQLWQCYGTPNQRFEINTVTQDSGNTLFHLVSEANKQCLQVRGASTANGAAVERAACSFGDKNQMWYWYAPILGGTEHGGYMTVRNARTGKCLDVNANSTADGAYVQQWDCNGTTAQAWATDIPW